MRLGSALFLLAAVLPGSAQAPRPIVSPEVHADRSVTFRLRAPNAEKVFLRLEGAKSLPMQKNDDGIWNATIGPVEPDYYGYSFIVDGVNLSDPSNSAIEHNLWRPLSEVHVPGPSLLPWEVKDVPHGTFIIISIDRALWVTTGISTCILHPVTIRARGSCTRFYTCCTV